jgi:AcrR family transcriptional regulator
LRPFGLYYPPPWRAVKGPCDKRAGKVAQATGLGRQSLYGAFGDKRALFNQVIERYFEMVLKPGIIDVLDAPGSGRENIGRLLTRMEQVVLAPNFNGCLVGNSIAELGVVDEETAALLARKLELTEEALFRALRRAKRAREVREDLDVRGTARALLAVLQGLAVVARVSRERSFVSGVLGNARRLLD